jgi:hypothetical protein
MTIPYRVHDSANVEVVSFSGYRIEQMWGVVGSQVRKYRVIVLHVGGNNLWDDHPVNILSKYQQLVSNIWQANPRCQVVISGLLPRGQDLFPGKMKSTQVSIFGQQKDSLHQ